MGNQTNNPINLDFLNPSLGLGSQYGASQPSFDMSAMDITSLNPSDWSNGAYNIANSAPTIGSSTVQDPGMLSNMMNSEMWRKMFGGENTDGTTSNGAFLPILQGFTGLAGLFQSDKGFGLAEDAFKQGQKEFNLNFGSSQDAYNNQVRGRAEEMAAAQGAGFNKQGYMDDRMMNRMTG